MHTLANSEDPDRLQPDRSSASALFAKINQPTEKEILFYLEIITCDPSLYIQWTFPSLIYHTRRNSLLISA